MSYSDIELVDKFCEYIRVEKNYSLYTVSDYKKDILDFADFLIREKFGSLERFGKRFGLKFNKNKYLKLKYKKRLNIFKVFFKISCQY